MSLDPDAGGSGGGKGQRQRPRTEEQAPIEQAPKMLDKEMQDQPTTGPQDVMHRYRERI